MTSSCYSYYLTVGLMWLAAVLWLIRSYARNCCYLTPILSKSLWVMPTAVYLKIWYWLTVSKAQHYVFISLAVIYCSDFKSAKPEDTLRIKLGGTPCEILGWMPQYTFDDKSTFSHVMACCRQYLANVDVELCRHMTSLGHDELMANFTNLQWCIYCQNDN